ncbi:MAG: tRNA preQ1(34) S-adenosylmethionine ribosyltransferase-isomerase QueA [Planctomycetota bacterium]|nr:tRNA preQ1(34) S-adenosylmethionine ribosyltransferase-isomerase QueA [Planctomycetota bacterium]
MSTENRGHSIDDYDYTLPKELIAQDPLPHRTDSRLMVVHRKTGVIEHSHFRELGNFVEKNDCLVFNDTRVVPAKLVGRRSLTGGRWHGLFLEPNEKGIWKILCKTRGKLNPGEKIVVENRTGVEVLEIEMLARLNDGEWAVRPLSDRPWSELLDEIGQIPLPHYIRGGAMKDSDIRNYQTVYAKKAGAVAAPTAGLHFSPEMLVALRDAGVQVASVTLHVGVGTFRPIKVNLLEDHEMHAERGEIDQATVDRIISCRANEGRVISVGTTSVRVLETVAAEPELGPWEGETSLFIRPPYQFRLVDALITNFHLPKSTLLVLISCFAGRELVREAYRKAVEEKYRFFSYGDAMLIL